MVFIRFTLTVGNVGRYSGPVRRGNQAASRHQFGFKVMLHAVRAIGLGYTVICKLTLYK
jgi:hypothetical protein